MTPYIHLNIGATVQARGQCWTILAPVSATLVAVQNKSTGEHAVLKVIELELADAEKAAFPEPATKISEKRWLEAMRRKEIIEVILAIPNRTRKDVEAHAREHDVAPSTVYRWIERWTETWDLQSLVPARRGPDPNGVAVWIDPVQKVFDALLEEQFLQKKRITPVAFHRRFKGALLKLEIKAPSLTATIRRLDKVPGLLKAKRQGDKRGEEKFSAAPGKNPSGKTIMSDYQIDHTPLSVVIVDRETRLPIGRPYLTLVIDVRSRMIVGLYLTLEPPCTTSVAMAISNTICPKEAFLNRLQVIGDWPVWGNPARIHADNAGEFRGPSIRIGCARRRIDMQWRPVKKPRYGAHIEALVGSVEEMVKELPGALFHKPEARGSYDSNEEAAFTLEELTQVLVHWAVRIYAVRPHAGLGGRTPMGIWNEGLLGIPGQTIGIGLPDRPTNIESLHVDFLPMEYRLVHPVGILIDNVSYFCDEIRSFVGVKNQWSKDTGGKYEVRRDDRAISPIYFLDPIKGDYIAVPYADLSRKVISRWELEEAARRVKELGKAEYSEAELFKAHEELEQRAKFAKETTKKRRREERQRVNNEAAQPAAAASPGMAQKSAQADNSLPKRNTPALAVSFDDVEDVS